MAKKKTLAQYLARIERIKDKLASLHSEMRDLLSEMNSDLTDPLHNAYRSMLTAAGDVRELIRNN